MQSRMPYAHREISAAPHLVCSFLWLLVVCEFERNSKAGRTKGIDQPKNKGGLYSTLDVFGKLGQQD